MLTGLGAVVARGAADDLDEAAEGGVGVTLEQVDVGGIGLEQLVVLLDRGVVVPALEGVLGRRVARVQRRRPAAAGAAR